MWALRVWAYLPPGQCSNQMWRDGVTTLNQRRSPLRAPNAASMARAPSRLRADPVRRWKRLRNESTRPCEFEFTQPTPLPPRG